MNKLLIACSLFFLSLGMAHATQDSLRVEKIEGQPYILHQLDQGETLFALSRRYHVSVQDIRDNNAEEQEGLKIDQVGRVLRIPLNTDFYGKENQATSTEERPTGKEHVVKSGETLFAISRQYKVSVADLKKWNNLPNNEISIGQTLVVSAEKPTKKEQKKEQHETQVAKSGEQFHVVEKGETLFSIARANNMSVADLKSWNHLVSNEIAIGQQLRLTPEEEQKANPVQQKTVTEETKKQEQEKVKDEQKKTEVAQNKKEEEKQQDDNFKSPDKTKEVFENPPSKEEQEETLKRVHEEGIAEVIAGSAQTDKYLALHRTAKIGTIMEVKNKMNDQVVFVRILGKLPQTGVDNKVVIKLSQKAFEKLGGVDKRIPVELSYLPLGD